MKNLLDIFIFFPMPFIWIMFVVLVFGSREKIYFYFKFIFILLFIISLPIFNNLLEIPLKFKGNFYNNEKNVSIILVPTAGIFRDPNYNWHASKASILRLIEGYNLGKNLGVPVVISGGKTIKNTPSESQVLKKYLTNDYPYILEENSKNSFQTAVNLKNLYKKYKFENGIVIVATSPLHNLRMNLVLRSNGFNSRNINYDYSKKSLLLKFIPQQDSFVRFNSCLYEYLAIIKYILFGYIDLKIIYT